MPRTASTRRRHQARYQGSRRLDEAPEQVAHTPLLFRLPLIETVLVDERELEEQPSSTQQAPELGSSSNGDTQESLSVEYQPIAAPPIVEKNSGAKHEPATRVAAVEQGDLQGESESEVERSWWEHWSSGVVLILLIIALIAASIIAFNDHADTDPSILAGEEPSALNTSQDLDEIQIPGVLQESQPDDLDRAKLISHPGTKSAVGESQSAASEDVGPRSPAMGSAPAFAGSIPNQVPADVPSPQTQQLSLENSHTSNVAGSLIPDSMQGGASETGSLQWSAESVSNSAVAQDGSLSASADGTTESALTQVPSFKPIAASPETGAKPGHPQLQSPVANQPTQLFPGNSTADATAQSTSEPWNVAGQQVIQRPAQPLSPKTSSPAGSESAPGMLDTKLPTYQDLIEHPSGAKSERFSTVAGQAGEARISTASHQRGTPSGSYESDTIVPSSEGDPESQPFQTATPDLDMESIISAYQAFQQMADPSASNRYDANGLP